MKLLRGLTLAAMATAATVPTMANAEYLYSFGSASVNYLDWTSSTEKKTEHRDFAFLELEGGAGFSWGEMYGFIDLENPFNSNKAEDGKGRRVAMKGTMRVNLGDTGFNLYGQIYDLSTNGFDEQNRVLGFGYNFAGDNFFFKPFLGYHNAQNTFFDGGSNGYMLGWVAGYNVNMLGESFMLSNWHETEFARDKNYQEGKKAGHNGALAMWWNATDSVTAGVQYRYAHNKLGNSTYQNGMVYTLKYNF